MLKEKPKSVNNKGKILDQIETCYRHYTPPQIKALKHGKG